MSGRITINLNVLSLDRRFGFDAYVDKLQAIEQAGLDGIVMPDHVVFGTNVQYPWGGWQIDPADSWPEPLSVLSAAAGATRRVSLVTNVLIAPLRPAPLLAKQVATLHGLSRGRFELGVGAGWQRAEYDASGIPFAARAEILFDQLRACRVLWRDRPASFHSSHVTFDDIWCCPTVADEATGRALKLWFGVAPTNGNVRLFEEFPAAGWSCIDPDPAVIARGRVRSRVGVVRGGCVAAAQGSRRATVGLHGRGQSRCPRDDREPARERARRRHRVRLPAAVRRARSPRVRRAARVAGGHRALDRSLRVAGCVGAPRRAITTPRSTRAAARSRSRRCRPGTRSSHRVLPRTRECARAIPRR